MYNQARERPRYRVLGTAVSVASMVRLRIGIHEAIERPGGVVFRCDLTASDAKRWLEIPAWMFDRSACAKVRLAVGPHTDLSALVMLGALLRDVRNIRSTQFKPRRPTGERDT